MTQIKTVIAPRDERGNDPNDFRDDPDYTKKLQHPLAQKITTLDTSKLEEKPKPKPAILKKYPIGASSGICAGGGVGKTQFACIEALRFATQGGQTLFVSAEDGPDDYQSKIHNTIHAGDGITLDDIAGKIHVMNLRGAGVKLVAEKDGCFRPSPEAKKLAETINATLPDVSLIFFETVSRLAGGEDNERLEAYVTATDAIAIETGSACVSVHHTGKAQSREKITDLYAGRGGSAFGDNTRCMLVLTRLDKDYLGERPTLAEPDDIAAGRVFEVKHVRYSYGPTVEPEYFVTRQGYCHGPILESLEIASEEQVLERKLAMMDAVMNAAATKVADIIKNKGGSIPRRYFDTNTRDLLGITQGQARELIQQMLEAGSLAEETEKTDSGQTRKVLVNRNQNKGV